MIAKRLARNLFAAGCRALLILERAEKRILEQLVILCYHRILPREKKKHYFLPDLVVTPESFDQHCSALKERYDVLPLSDAYLALRQQELFNRPLAAITFDDGYQDNYVYAAPILAKHELRATFFVVTDLLGGDRPPWYDQMGQAVGELIRKETIGRANAMLNELGFSPRRDGRGAVQSGTSLPVQVVRHAKTLTPTQRNSLLTKLLMETGENTSFAPNDLIMNELQLRELLHTGHEIGSHSRTHEILTQLGDARLKEEIVGSRETLEKLLNQPVRSFCYPNGDFDDRVVQAVADAGYSCATSVATGHNSAQTDPFRLRRRFIHEERLLAIQGSSSHTLLRMELCGLSAKSSPG